MSFIRRFILSKKNTSVNYSKLSFFVIGLILINCDVMAESINVNITGNIRYSPCKVNSDKDFQIDFGTIELDKIDGSTFAKKSTLDVVCSNSKGTPYIKVTSTGVTEGNNILKTTGPNSSTLGIALYQGDSVSQNSPLKIGTGNGYGYQITKGLAQVNSQQTTFTFTAVPTKYGNTSLQAGSFSSSMTLSIEYN